MSLSKRFVLKSKERTKMPPKKKVEEPSPPVSENTKKLNTKLKRVKNPPPQVEEVEEVEDEETKDDEILQKWSVSIEGMKEMDAKSFRFSVLTPGESSTGSVVAEFFTKPKVNSSFIEWLHKPSERKLKVEINDGEGKRIESWEMNATPVAVAVGELETEMTERLYTTVQMSVKQITVI